MPHKKTGRGEILLLFVRRTSWILGYTRYKGLRLSLCGFIETTGSISRSISRK